MKNRFFLALLILASAITVHAQGETTMSLKQCIDYALLHSASVNNAQLDEYIAAAKVGEVKATGLPQINGEAAVIDNPQLRPMFFKGDNQFIPAIPGVTPDPNNVIAVPNIFQLRSSGEASATLTQLLFNGSFLVALKTTKAYSELSTKATQKAKIDVVEAVKKAYYMVLINGERINSLNSNIARLDTTFKQTQALNKSGFVEKLDLNRLEVRYLNLVTEKQKFENMSALSVALLKFQMGMPAKENFILEGNIESLKATLMAATETTDMDYSRRIEYSLLESQKKINQQILKNVNVGYLPSLAAFGTFGYTRSDVRFGNLFTKKWYNFSMIGIKATIPIFDGLSKHYQAQQAKLEIKKTENNIESFKNAIDLQVTQSSITYNNAVKSLETQSKNLELSKEIARVSKIKYQEGVGTNLELVNAEADLKDAQTNYYDAIYQALVSTIDYQKSTGKLSAE